MLFKFYFSFLLLGEFFCVWIQKIWRVYSTWFKSNKKKFVSQNNGMKFLIKNLVVMWTLNIKSKHLSENLKREIIPIDYFFLKQFNGSHWILRKDTTIPMNDFTPQKISMQQKMLLQPKNSDIPHRCLWTRMV